jgi:hypothetical protein
MTQAQIKWAASHDWYIATLATADGVLVLDQWIDKHGQLHSQDRTFHDYRALRDWAGY